MSLFRLKSDKVDSAKLRPGLFLNDFFRFSIDSHQKNKSGEASAQPHVQRRNLSFHLDFKEPQPCGSTFLFKEAEIC